MEISAGMISSLTRTGEHEQATTPREAFREFETLLLAEALKGGQKPMGGAHPLDGGSAGTLYREQFADAVAQKMAEAGGVGIARQLLEQHLRKEQASAPEVEVPADDASQATTVEAEGE